MNRDVKNRGLMADLRLLIEKKPGLTPRELTVEAQKIVRNGVAMYPHIGNSASSSISQLVKSGRAHYRLGPKGDSGQQIFIVYPDKGPRLVGSNHGAHRGDSKKKKRKYNRRAVVFTPAEAYPNFGAANRKASANGHAKVDVQLLIAIGDKDTMVGFEAGRELYNQLRAIFEKA